MHPGTIDTDMGDQVLVTRETAQAYSGASIWPALRGAQGEIQGVELVRSPMRADDSSARFISMSLKTSKYSLGGALRCCRVQPVPQTRSFPRPSRFDRTTILRCREGCCKVRWGCAHRPQDGARRLSLRPFVPLFRCGVVPSRPKDAYLANLERHGRGPCEMDRVNAEGACRGRHLHGARLISPGRPDRKS